MCSYRNRNALDSDKPVENRLVFDFEAQHYGFPYAFFKHIEGFCLGVATAQGRNCRHEPTVLILFYHDIKFSHFRFSFLYYTITGVKSKSSGNAPTHIESPRMFLAKIVDPAPMNVILTWFLDVGC